MISKEIEIDEPTIFVACRWAEEFQDINNHIKGLIKRAGMSVSGKMEKTGVVPLALKETINIMDAHGFCVVLIPQDRNIAPPEVLYEISTARIYQIPAFMFVEKAETSRPEVLGNLRAHQADLNCPGEWFEFRKSDLLSGRDDDRILRWLKDVKRFVISEYAKIHQKIESGIASQWAQLSDLQPFHTGLLQISEAYDKEPAILYNAAARAAAEITGAEFGFVGMLEPREEWMEIEIKGIYASSKSKEDKILNALNETKLGYNYEGETFGITGYATKMGVPIREGHLQRDSEKLKEVGKNFIDPGNLKIQSELCVPIEIKGRIVGVIDVESNFENQFQKVHQMILEWLAKVLAIAYSGEQLESLINDLSKSLVAADKKGLSEKILSTLMKWSQADSGFIGICRKNSCLVETIKGSGLKPEIKELFDNNKLEIDPNKGLSGKVLSSGKAIYSEEVAREEKYLEWFKPVRSEIVLPIKSKTGSVIGVVDIEFTSPQKFENIDKNLFENLANILAGFLD